jgi:hypothetical protein
VQSAFFTASLLTYLHIYTGINALLAVVFLLISGGSKCKVFYLFLFLFLFFAAGINALVAIVFLLISGGSKCKVPINEISISGGTQMLAMASSNEALYALL